MKIKRVKEQKGITLIALVVTIIVLLILAGVAISMLSGENGILKQVANAKESSENQSKKEKIKLAITAAMTNVQHKIDKTQLEEELQRYFKNVNVKGNESYFIEIDNDVYKVDSKGNLIEDTYLKEKVSSTSRNINLNNSTGDDLVDYKIYGNSVQNNLPDEYQEVEYIESTGTQYIDTKYVPNKDTEIKANVAFMEKTNSLQQFGVITNLGTSGNAKYSRWHFGVFENMLTCFKTTLSSSGDVKLTYDNNFHEYYLSNTTAKIDDTSATPATTSNSNVTFTLFARNGYTDTGGSAKISNYAKAKLKTFKIYENSILIMGLVPCYRKSDNIIGLYETVNNVFYTNEGTGTFIAGAEIPNPDNPIEIQSVGDLVTDESNENYGKYKIPFKVNDNVTNIYLDEPLRKIGDYADYIDFKNKKIVRNVEVVDNTGTLILEESLKGLTTPIEESIELPIIPTNEGTNIVEINTLTVPSNIEISYIKNNKEE